MRLRTTKRAALSRPCLLVIQAVILHCALRTICVAQGIAGEHTPGHKVGKPGGPREIVNSTNFFNFTKPDHSWAKFYAQSSDAPLRASLPRSAAASAYELQSFYSVLHKKLQEDKKELAGKVDTETCNLDQRYADTVKTYFQLRGMKWPVLSCPTERVYERNDNALRLWDLVQRFQNDVNASVPQFVSKMRLPRAWTKVFPTFVFLHKVEQQICTVRHQGAVMIGSTWYLWVRVTNLPFDEESQQREYVVEHVYADAKNHFGPSLWMRLPKRDPKVSPNAAWKFVNETKDGKTIVGIADATSSWSTLGGRATPGMPTSADVDNLEAVKSALKGGEIDQEQVDDARQISNIAILALPLAMNLVPVALIADVNDLGMLLYTALTDVLTAVPLMIKGIELMVLLRKNYVSTATRVVGIPAWPNHALAETWVASCEFQVKHDAYAIFFIVGASVFMIFGVTFEFVARAYVRKKFAYHHADAHKPNTAPIAAQYATNSHLLPGAVGLAMNTNRGAAPRANPQCACACHAHPHAHAHPSQHATAAAHHAHHAHHHSSLPSAANAGSIAIARGGAHVHSAALQNSASAAPHVHNEYDASPSPSMFARKEW